MRWSQTFKNCQQLTISSWRPISTGKTRPTTSGWSPTTSPRRGGGRAYRQVQNLALKDAVKAVWCIQLDRPELSRSCQIQPVLTGAFSPLGMVGGPPQWDGTGKVVLPRRHLDTRFATPQSILDAILYESAFQ